MNKKRPIHVGFRMSENEFQELEYQAKKYGMTKQEYILRSVLNRPILTKVECQQMLLEIRRQGNNLNQIAKCCNQGNIDVDKIDKICMRLEEMWQSLKL